MFLFSSYSMPTFEMTLISSVPFIPALLLPEVRLSKSEGDGINPGILRFVPPVIILYLLAGFMYHTMEPVFREARAGLHSYDIDRRIPLPSTAQIHRE